jgi:glycerol-3-phosphate acyltransferase PlsY
LDWIKVLLWIACAVQAYLLGSVSFAYILGKLFIRRDIRKYGSGNAGATNMTRNFGWKLGLLTFICDILKGSAGAWIGSLIDPVYGAYIGAVFAVAGHNWPVFFEFRGGKGAATTLGVALVLMPLEALCVIALVGLIILLTRTVSIGSIAGSALLIVVGFVFYPGNLPLQICAILLCGLVVFSHRENIKRLANGTESKMSFKGKAKPKKLKTNSSEGQPAVNTAQGAKPAK